MSLGTTAMTTSTTTGRQFPCKKCGAALAFEPGQTALTCPYCQTRNQIQAAAEPVVEEDYGSFLAQQKSGAATSEMLTVKCSACGAQTSLRKDVTADRCPFCGTAIVAEALSQKSIRPRSLLPFHITQPQAQAAYKTWIASLWFAPGDLLRYAEADGIKGVYLPYWTYDARTDSWYTGQRGDDYWETESYTTFENGRSVTRTRQVRKTRWRPVSGRVLNTFDDVLVLASQSLPPPYIEKLEPWDLKNLAPYGDEYLAGFTAESYQVNLEEGFERAKGKMDPVIRQTVCRDIGGDQQQISSLRTSYADITFKHILLPVWISAYRYREQVYRFMINARTGEVSGQRPWSAAKIVLAVVAAAAVAAAVVLLVSTLR